MSSRILILTPDRNSPSRQADYTGAFRPEAEAFAAKWGGEIVRIDQSKTSVQRFEDVLRAVRRAQPEIVAIFGHGLWDRFPQFGITKATAADFARELTQFGEHGPLVTAPTVLGYACLAAGKGVTGDGSVLDTIRDACVKFGALGVKAWGHETAGHTDKNPHSRCFKGPEAKPENIGGKHVVAPGSKLWRAWVRYCQGPGRLEFWALPPEELERRLEGSILETR